MSAEWKTGRTAATDRAMAAARGLHASEVDFVAYLPSNSIVPIINFFRDAERRPRAFPVGREEEAVGIIGAVNLAGYRGAIVMQDNGFGNSLTALATWPVAYHIPLPILANTRGGLGEYNSMIHVFSERTFELLRAVNVPAFRLDRRNPLEDWQATVEEAVKHAWMTHRPAVVLMEFWGADA